MKTNIIAHNIILSYKDIFGKQLTHLKLQKLLYYSYAWSLVNGESFSKNAFEKWKHGPVNSEVYQEFKQFGELEIPTINISYTNIDKGLAEIVYFIVANYGKFSALTLSAMTHQDDPWKNSKAGIISDKSIKKFYSSLNFAKNFPINIKNPFYPVETDNHYSFILDFSHKSKIKPFAYNSYFDYLKLEIESKKVLNKLLNAWEIN